MKLKGHMTQCTCLAEGYNGTGTILVTGSEDTNVKVWDLRMKSNQCIFSFKEHQGAVLTVQLSPDSKWVASGGVDGALKIWDISTGRV